MAARFQSVPTLRFIPESYLPNAPYIPTHFVADSVTLDATNFEYELDELGQSSIIRLQINDEILVPFIDTSKYDSETKDWFWYDVETNFPYRHIKSTNKLESIYPSEYLDLTLTGSVTFDKTLARLISDVTDSNNKKYVFFKYSPLILTVNNQAYTDLSDYSNFRSTTRLNKVDTTIPEYYYDFNSRIYSNRSLAGVDPAQVKIHFFKISDNNVKVKCRFSANLDTETYYTPKVNNFIVKLKGQSLGI